jgi:DNA-binding response OmpR family regulator
VKLQSIASARTDESNFTISIVEDEPVLRNEMEFQLKHHGFQVEGFATAAQFYRYHAVRQATIAVLDIGLRGEDGLSICQHLRDFDPNIGIVFVTARSLRNDRLTGLAAGADAYLVKPVDIDELVLILKRLGKRFAAQSQAASPKASALAGSQWQYEPSGSFVIAPSGVRVRLSVSEGQLLRALAAKSGSPCFHTELAIALGLFPHEYDKHRVEVIVSRLRVKVERESGLSLPLRSVRGVGYSLDL